MDGSTSITGNHQSDNRLGRRSDNAAAASRDSQTGPKVDRDILLSAMTTWLKPTCPLVARSLQHHVGTKSTQKPLYGAAGFATAAVPTTGLLLPAARLPGIPTPTSAKSFGWLQSVPPGATGLQPSGGVSVLRAIPLPTSGYSRGLPLLVRIHGATTRRSCATAGVRSAGRTASKAATPEPDGRRRTDVEWRVEKLSGVGMQVCRLGKGCGGARGGQTFDLQGGVQGAAQRGGGAFRPTERVSGAQDVLHIKLNIQDRPRQSRARISPWRHQRILRSG